jgi:3-hydroxy acid dehydrogenase/malonic semialdehyde reductase
MLQKARHQRCVLRAQQTPGRVALAKQVKGSVVEAHGSSGTIINIGSVARATLYPGGNVYGATKAFVEQITRNLRATNLAPGLCGGSEFSPVGRRGNGAVAAKVYEGAQPLSCEDIAETAFEMMPTCQGYDPLVIKRKVSDA